MKIDDKILLRQIQDLEDKLAQEKRRSEYFREIAIQPGKENMKDIFEMRRLLSELKDSQRHIEELAEKAIRSDRIKSEFLSMMSHEIRTPMTSLLGFLTLIDNTELDEKQKTFIAHIRKSADYLFELMKNIQDMARIEAGELELVKNQFDISNIFIEINHIFAERLPNNNVRFNIMYPNKGKAILFSDPKRVRQMCYNLVSNAVKFTEEGFINISYDIEDDNFSFIVEDSGPGIPEDRIEYIFEKFTQLDTSLNRKHYGMGIGLSIVKRLCELMDVKIDVSSMPGRGSCFRLTFPCLSPCTET